MPLGKGAVGVEFRDVNFSYAGRNVPVLSNLNLKVSENVTFLTWRHFNKNSRLKLGSSLL
jgi:ABC-type multidrug transport system fused ATPase/permease subunit